MDGTVEEYDTPSMMGTNPVFAIIDLGEQSSVLIPLASIKKIVTRASKLTLAKPAHNAVDLKQ